MSRPSAYDAAFASLFPGGTALFGHATAHAEERLEAALWIVCDVDLGTGATPLELRQRQLEDPHLELLSTTQLQAWEIERPREAGLIDAACPVSGERATLETVRAPAGDLRPGGFLVARSLPRGEARFALLGSAPVLEAEAERDFEMLLADLAVGSAPELLWRRVGGRLASAAWSWVEEREHTREGEPVQDVHVVYGLPDVARTLEALDADPELDRDGAQDDDETAVWRWRATAPAQPPRPLPQEPGVRWELCDEDSANPPVRARIEVGLHDDDLWLFAPTEERLQDAESELARRLPGLLGDQPERFVDHPSIMRRWQRDRFERSIQNLPLRLQRLDTEPGARFAA